MNTGNKIDEQEAMYYLPFQVVNWVEVFTRKQFKDINIEFGSFSAGACKKGRSDR